ncbi:MAG: sulfatase-like hydrolase/transferase [Proteiniphilum sp.]|nr:sulfatase-like hydrolase/transferase [Proteiniphilum sp.]
MEKGMLKNILFFFTDQQRWDTCGCYGRSLPVTPNLDAMAKEGVLFEHAYSCQPVCGPARSCLQTGKYATENGCFKNGLGLPLDERTIAHHFNAHGYRTGYIGKWHLASTNKDKNTQDDGSTGAFPRGQVPVSFHRDPVPVMYRGGWEDEWIVSDVLEFTSHGYDGHMFDKQNRKKYFPEGRYRADAQTDWVLDTLDSWSEDKSIPFFLFVSYIEPHQQNDHDRFEGPIGSKEKFADYETPGDLKDHGGDWRENYPDYLGAVHSLDENLGRVREKLKENGLEKDTVIVFASDHGSHFRTRNGEYKRTCHEASTHVPLVVYHPDYVQSQRISSMVSLIDLPPTFLDLAQIEIPYTFQGESLVPFLDGEHTVEAWDDSVFIQVSESEIGRAVRTKKWCYGITASGKDAWTEYYSDEYVDTYLYDLQADPHEQNNLIGTPGYEEIIQELRASLLEYIRTVEKREPAVKSCC